MVITDKLLDVLPIADNLLPTINSISSPKNHLNPMKSTFLQALRPRFSVTLLFTANLVACAGLFLSGGVLADTTSTVGWWRFEDSANLGKDSSGSGNHLTVNSTPTQVATPFGSSVPLTGDTNTKALSMTAKSTQSLSMADSITLDFTSFTFEAFVKTSAFDGTNFAAIGGQFGFSTNLNANANWVLGVMNTGELFLRLGNSPNGGKTTTDVRITNTPPVLTSGKDYYIGVSVAPKTTGDGLNITFYIKDLAAPTEQLQTFVATSTIKALTTTATSPFVIGAICDSTNAIQSTRFGGTIDEVRLTNGVLTQDQLLISSVVPEPSTYAVVLGLIALIGVGVRRVYTRRR